MVGAAGAAGADSLKMLLHKLLKMLEDSSHPVNNTEETSVFSGRLHQVHCRAERYKIFFLLPSPSGIRFQIIVVVFITKKILRIILNIVFCFLD